jgi:hypothetical protein
MWSISWLILPRLSTICSSGLAPARFLLAQVRGNPAVGVDHPGQRLADQLARLDRGGMQRVDVLQLDPSASSWTPIWSTSATAGGGSAGAGSRATARCARPCGARRRC